MTTLNDEIQRFVELTKMAEQVKPQSTHAENRQNETETMHAASREINHLLEVKAVMLEALEALLQLTTDGILVRDTRNDHDPAWAIKQMPLVMALKKADEAIKLAKGEQS